jgi:hypothetical protein
MPLAGMTHAAHASHHSGAVRARDLRRTWSPTSRSNNSNFNRQGPEGCPSRKPSSSIPALGMLRGVGAASRLAAVAAPVEASPPSQAGKRTSRRRDGAHHGGGTQLGGPEARERDGCVRPRAPCRRMIFSRPYAGRDCSKGDHPRSRAFF